MNLKEKQESDRNKSEQKRCHLNQQLESKKINEKEKKKWEINKNEQKRCDSVKKIVKENINNKINSSNNISFSSNSSINDKIIFDSYCPTDIDCSFIVFFSVNKKNPYIIYTDMKKSICCYNLMNNKIEQEKKNAHVEPISNFRYYFNRSYNEYIMSLSYRNKQIKIWDFKTWNVKFNLLKIYQEGFLYSACFLKNRNNFAKSLFLTSNWVDSKNVDYIRIYDYSNCKGDKYKIIKESNDNVLFMDTYYDIDKNIEYIITSNKGYIKSYNYNENKLYYKYHDNKNYSNIFSFIINKENNFLKIIESSEHGTIRIWDFHSGSLYFKFDIETNWIGGICLYNKDYLLVGCGDKTIKLIKIKEGIVSDCLRGHQGKVCSIKKLKISNTFFSLGKDNKIRKWENIINIK